MANKVRLNFKTPFCRELHSALKYPKSPIQCPRERPRWNTFHFSVFRFSFCDVYDQEVCGAPAVRPPLPRGGWASSQWSPDFHGSSDTFFASLAYGLTVKSIEWTQSRKTRLSLLFAVHHTANLHLPQKNTYSEKPLRGFTSHAEKPLRGFTSHAFLYLPRKNTCAFWHLHQKIVCLIREYNIYVIS